MRKRKSEILENLRAEGGGGVVDYCHMLCEITSEVVL